MTDRFVPIRESRVRVDRTGDGLRIFVPPRRSLWQLAVFGWVLFVFGFGLVMMVTGDEEPGPVFIAAWCTIGLWILSGAIWAVFSREELTLDSRALRHARRIGAVGRSRAYDRSRVDHLRVSPESLPPSDFRHGLRMYGIGGGTVTFDYGARTVRMAQVDEAEARRIVEALANEGVGG